MAIIVSAPDAFYDAEPWEFDLTVNESDGSAPMDLTGSELFVRFVSLSDNVPVGVCSTAAANGSLTIADPLAGKVRVIVPSQGRTWRLSAVRPGGLLLPSTVVGDLFRRASAQGEPKGIGRIQVRVLPSTGAT